MDYIQALLRKYPNRIKYGIFIVDVFAMLLAIKTYTNYLTIETAIDDATIQQQIKTDELAFTQNFLINYEKSEFAQYFLEHENNMLLTNEYIIKFEEMYQKTQTATWATTSPFFDNPNQTIKTPQESRKKFIMERIK